MSSRQHAHSPGTAASFGEYNGRSKDGTTRREGAAGLPGLHDDGLEHEKLRGEHRRICSVPQRSFALRVVRRRVGSISIDTLRVSFLALKLQGRRNEDQSATQREGARRLAP